MPSKAAAARLANPAVSGEPEHQLRGPFEVLLRELALLCCFKPDEVIAVGESPIAALRIRPDCLLYSDSNEFSRWRNGQRAGEPVRLDGDIETSGGSFPGYTARIGHQRKAVGPTPSWPSRPVRSGASCTTVCRHCGGC